MTREMNEKLLALRAMVDHVRKGECSQTMESEVPVSVAVLAELFDHNAGLFRAVLAAHRYFVACAAQYLHEGRSESGAKIVGGEAMDNLSDQAGDAILAIINKIRVPGQEVL